MLSVLLLTGAPTNASAPTLQLVAPSGPQPGLAPLNVEVRLLQAANLGAWEFDLHYDPARLAVTGVTIGDFFARTANCDGASARCAIALGPFMQNGLLSAGAISYGQAAGANGDGVIAVLHLQPKGLPGVTTLHLTNALLTDVAANPITPAISDATLEFTPASFANNLVYLPLVAR
jgi:hypothetical protein